MKINYKITTLILALALIVTFVWVCGDRNEAKMEMGNMQGGHMMQDGSMMMNDRSMNMDSMMMNMVANMKGKSGKELEKAFITDMIPHHQGAVDMAKLLLEDKTIRPELVKFANDIIAAQEAEIATMKMWLKDWSVSAQ